MYKSFGATRTTRAVIYNGILPFTMLVYKTRCELQHNHCILQTGVFVKCKEIVVIDATCRKFDFYTCAVARCSTLQHHAHIIVLYAMISIIDTRRTRSKPHLHIITLTSSQEAANKPLIDRSNMVTAAATHEDSSNP